MATNDKSYYEQQIEMSKTVSEDAEEKLISQAVLRLNGKVVGIVLGVIFAVVIFGATNWLVLKGGEEIGPHLSLLGQFFVGYTVTFTGSLIGAVYGFVTGFVAGVVIGWVYNYIVSLKSSASEN